jgi:hypothetical protein
VTQVLADPTNPAQVSVVCSSHVLAVQGWPGTPLLHAGRPRLVGSPAKGTHRPLLPASALPGSLQVSHWPRQGALQHTPSTQKPDEHSPELWQGAPRSCFEAHLPPRQNPAAEQSAAPAHAWVHVPCAQVYAPQSEGAPGTHAPALHWYTTEALPAQAGLLQEVPSA